MTRLDWWTGIILVLVGPFIGNAAVSALWMQWGREWWHYVLPFWLGGAVGFFTAGLAAAAKRAQADADRQRRAMAVREEWRRRELYGLRSVVRPVRPKGGERN